MLTPNLVRGSIVAMLVVSIFPACGDVQESAPEAVVTATTGTSTPPSTADSGIEDLALGIDDVVRFEAGATSAMVAGGVIRGERSRYRLDANAGQTLNLTLMSLEDNAVLDVYGPDGEPLEREVTECSLVLPTSGTYTVIVGGTRGNASYELAIEIPA